MVTNVHAYTTNRITLCGEVKKIPQFAYVVNEIRMFTFPLAITRASGNVDTLNIYITEELLKQNPPIVKGNHVLVNGCIRTRDNIPTEKEKARLVIYVQARSLELVLAGGDKNYAQIIGHICTPPRLRITTPGLKVCNLILSVNGKYRTSHIPCIAWGAAAEWAAEQSIGMNLDVFGRLQSREYAKQLENGTSELRTAYEFSISKVFMDVDQRVQ